MDSPFYSFEVLEDAYRFTFNSVGQNGVIPKIIIYSKTDLPDYYNLALGDVRTDGTVDVFSKSNNGDMEKILATVIQTLMVFLAYHPEANVFFAGSTPTRTRLYQIVLNKEIDKVDSTLKVLGLYEDYLEPFEPNKNYEGFVVSKKKSNI